MTYKERNIINLSLRKEWHAVLQQIAARTRRSMAEELRIIIDRRAEEVGVPPVVPTRPVPKYFKDDDE